MIDKISKFLVSMLSKIIKSYVFLISPILGNNCRFYPNCSTYFIQCLESFGVIRGSFLGFWRILRCNPYNKSFGIDNPPSFGP